MISTDRNKFSMILMHINVGREVGVKVWLVGWIETKDEIALEISWIIEVGSWRKDQMKFHSYHVAKICFIYD